jgi:hypothetical protein
MAAYSTLVQIQSLPILPEQLARAGLHSSPAGNSFSSGRSPFYISLLFVVTSTAR